MIQDEHSIHLVPCPVVPQLDIDRGFLALASSAAACALCVYLAAIKAPVPFFAPACSVFFAPQAIAYPFHCFTAIVSRLLLACAFDQAELRSPSEEMY